MKWYEISIATTEEACDAVSEMLNSTGAGGVAIEDPDEIRRQVEKPGSREYIDENFLESLGTDVVIKAYFKETINIEELMELIREKLAFISGFLDTGKGLQGYTEVDDEDWANTWKKYYKPVHISPMVVVKPSWEEYSALPGEIVIELDPGMAFGTGTHETTRMCAELLEKHIKAGDKVLDVGCGTGILAITAVKLGAYGVTAVDIDEVAVRVAMENCAMNNVNEVKCFKGVLTDIEEQRADVIVANIIASVIIDIAGPVQDHLKKDGIFITSGIIRDRRDEVVGTYSARGFKLEETLTMGEWVAMVFRCQDSL